MLKKYSLKKQFILTFALVLLCSVVSFIVTLGIGSLLINGKGINPANHYEKMISKIESYIKLNNIELLDEKYKNELNKQIPSKGIKYRVLDLEKNTSYGTLEELSGKISYKEEDIINKINTSEVDNKNNVIKYIPIISDNHKLEGVILLSYDLLVTSDNISKNSISLISVIVLVSPFIYIVLFAYLFGKKLANNINEPLNKLNWASSKIKDKDLDFELEYPYNNELGVVINSFDEMKKELKYTLDKQWKMEEERKEIISGLSHDLRSPLTVIRGKSEMLLEGSYKNEDRLMTYLQSINKSADRAMILVKDLNAINKLEDSKFSISPSQNNIDTFIKEKLEEFKALANEKSINISIELLGIDDKITWYFDEEAISRVLDNIITNSIRYSYNNGSIKICIRVEEDKLYFDVIDNGKGFSDDELKFALNKFYRGDKARSVNSGNSGLGLYISKKIIEKHNGEISILNGISKGARVEFYIKNMEEF